MAYRLDAPHSCLKYCMLHKGDEKYSVNMGQENRVSEAE